MEIEHETCHWKKLKPDVIRKIASFAEPSHAACSIKLVDTDTAAALRGIYNLITLGQKHTGNSGEPHRAKQPWPVYAFVAHWGCPEPWRSLSLPQRERLLCLAASSGHAPSLEAALAQCGCALKPEVLTAAAAAGNLASCERLLHEGCSFDRAALKEAARGGHLQVLQLLIRNLGFENEALSVVRPRRQQEWKWDCFGEAAEGACAGGQPHILDWLQQAHGYNLRAPDVLEAARAGQVGLFEELLTRPLLIKVERPPEDLSFWYRYNIRGNPADLWRPPGGAAAWARRELNSNLLCAIVQGCPLEVLERHYPTLWLPAIQFSSREHMAEAAVGSPTPCWAAKLDFLLDAWGPEVAARVLEVERPGSLWSLLYKAARLPDLCARLRHLHKRGAPPSRAAVEYAVRGGHVDALAYLLDECGLSVQLDDDSVCKLLRLVINRFAPRGVAAVLQLLRDRGARLVGWRLAAQIQDQEALCWLAENAAEDSEEQEQEQEQEQWQEQEQEEMKEVKKQDGQEQGNAGGTAEGVPPAEGRGRQRRVTAAVRVAWSGAFGWAARQGAGLTLLRALRARGAAMDLGAVAEGGGEEALEWAAAELEAEGRAPQALSVAQACAVFCAGNAAALRWLQHRRLLPPAPAGPAGATVGWLSAVQRPNNSTFWHWQLSGRLQEEREEQAVVEGEVVDGEVVEGKVVGEEAVQGEKEAAVEVVQGQAQGLGQGQEREAARGEGVCVWAATLSSLRAELAAAPTSSRAIEKGVLVVPYQERWLQAQAS